MSNIHILIFNLIVVCSLVACQTGGQESFQTAVVPLLGTAVAQTQTARPQPSATAAPSRTPRRTLPAVSTPTAWRQGTAPPPTWTAASAILTIVFSETVAPRLAATQTAVAGLSLERWLQIGYLNLQQLQGQLDRALRGQAALDCALVAKNYEQLWTLPLAKQDAADDAIALYNLALQTVRGGWQPLYQNCLLVMQNPTVPATMPADIWQPAQNSLATGLALWQQAINIER